MKGVLVILDGLGDLPCKQLEDKTPLEAAEMPNLNFLAARGEMGYMYSVKPGFVPQSDEAIVSIFGNDLNDSSRGQLETRGTDIKLVRGDLALRVNFATIDSPKNGNVIDRRVGRTLTTNEAEILAKAINKIKISCPFIFKPTIQHRAVLVFRGGFSDNFSSNDSAYSHFSVRDTGKIGTFKTLDDDENTQFTVNVLKEFIDKAYSVLENHPINAERRKKGLLPANYLIVRGQGIEPPKLKFYRKWAAIAYMPLEIGFAKTSGMRVFSFDYPRMKGLDFYENLRDGLQKVCEFSIYTLKKNHKDFDYMYLHIKETDLPGHDNKPIEKKEMLEYIDSTVFKFLREFAPPNKIKVVVTGDHSTPCKLKAHSADPVPVLLYNVSPPKKKISKVGSIFGKITGLYNKKNSNVSIISQDSMPAETESNNFERAAEKFCEKNARRGKLGSILGKEILEKVGFLE